MIEVENNLAGREEGRESGVYRQGNRLTEGREGGQFIYQARKWLRGWDEKGQEKARGAWKVG